MRMGNFYMSSKVMILLVLFVFSLLSAETKNLVFLSTAPSSIIISKEAYFRASKTINNNLVTGIIYRHGIDSTDEYTSAGIFSRYFFNEHYAGPTLSLTLTGNFLYNQDLVGTNEFEALFHTGYRIYIASFFIEPLLGYRTLYSFRDKAWGGRMAFNLLTGIRVF